MSSRTLRSLFILLHMYAISTPVFGASVSAEASLRIVVARSAHTLVVDRLIDGFVELYPNTKIEITTMGSMPAISEAKNGNADILIIHYPPAERELLRDGVAGNRVEFMFSSYAIFGPPNDELGLLQESTIQSVLKKLAANKVAFISPSRNGGTYQKLSDLWASVGIKPDWPWYDIANTTGLGTMRLAAEQEAYTLADIATYLLHREELSSSLVPLYQGGYELHKPFSIMQINPDNVYASVNQRASDFVEFITSDMGQQIITKINREKFNAPIFFPAAHFDPGVIAKRAKDKLERTRRNLYIVSGFLIATGCLLFIVFYMIFKTRYFRKAKLNAEIGRGIAEQANNAKSEFLSRMSHELRTPMNAILGFSQILEMKEQDAEKKKNLREIVKAGQHLHHLIDDVLELSSLETNLIKISLNEVVIGEMIDDSLSLCQKEIKQNQVNVTVIGDIHSKVSADPTRLKEVLLNLISNAAKYNKPNGRMTIAVEKQLGQERLRLSVTDTGRGISEAQQGHLFEPFERLGLERSAIEGTGIGLVISKNIVERMSGNIGYKSVLGEGSTFWIELPLVVDKITTVVSEEITS